MFEQLIYFYLAIFLVFFLPGYFLMRVIFIRNYNQLASLEKLLITFIFSLATTDALMLLMNYLNIPIVRKNLFFGIIGISFVFGVVLIMRMFYSRHQNYTSPSLRLDRETTSKTSQYIGRSLKARLFAYFVRSKSPALLAPAYRQILLFIVLLGFSVFLRSVYIADGIFPKTTDFGHHMYWANYISTNQTLPTYDEKFIIGEHLPFAAINILSGISYISALPVIILFLFNIFTLIGVFLLTYWLAVPFNKTFQKIFPDLKKISPYDIALWGLFVIGILYPISAPQVKFVSGGVIGNVIGNLLIITSVYAFLRVILSTKSSHQKSNLKKSTGAEAKLFIHRNFNEDESVPLNATLYQPKSSPPRENRPGLTSLLSQSFVFLFLISIISLVYTHHLSSFIFIYSFVAILIGFIILTLIFVKFNIKIFIQLVWMYLQPFIESISVIFFALGLFLILNNTIFLIHSVLLKNILGYLLVLIGLASLLTLLYTKIKYNRKINLSLIIITLFTAFLLWQVRIPSYLNPEAIDVAVGTPTKITRVGFGFSQIIERVGSWKILFAGVFGVIGSWMTLKILFFSEITKPWFSGNKIWLRNFIRSLKARLFACFARSKSLALLALSRALAQPYFVSFALAISILFAWAGILFLMSWKPGLLKVDIPSRRIVTYLTYPITIMAGFGIAYFFVIIKTQLSKQLFSFLFLFFIGIGIISGFGQDITANQRTTAGKFEVSSLENSREVMQTYLASIYLANNINNNEIILKDHKFLAGDTWMKIFFMRGYKYPLSRTYDRRYEDVIKKRETCTRDMVLKPNSEIGQECFEKTGTKYIVLKKGFDDAVFRKSSEFQLVYVSKDVVVFEKR